MSETTAWYVWTGPERFIPCCGILREGRYFRVTERVGESFVSQGLAQRYEEPSEDDEED